MEQSKKFSDYTIRKTFAAGSLDLALLLANVSQMKILSELEEFSFKCILVFALVGCSIILQVAVGCMLIYLGYQENSFHKDKPQNLMQQTDKSTSSEYSNTDQDENLSKTSNLNSEKGNGSVDAKVDIEMDKFYDARGDCDNCTGAYDEVDGANIILKTDSSSSGDSSCSTVTNDQADDITIQIVGLNTDQSDGQNVHLVVYSNVDHHTNMNTSVTCGILIILVINIIVSGMGLGIQVSSHNSTQIISSA